MENQESTSTEENNLLFERSKYDSKWEYTIRNSNWHFDKWREEAPFKVFARIEWDWNRLFRDLQYEINVGTRGYGYKGKEGDGIIEKDFLDWGYGKDMVQFNRTYELPEYVDTLLEPLGLISPDIRIHRQQPGMVTPIHVDGFSSHPRLDEDPTVDQTDMTRLIIQLRDWDWGHFWGFGNAPWLQWHAGDVAFFDSRNIVHYTANAGKEPRISMIVTAWMSEKTKQLVNGDFQIFKPGV